MQAGENLDIYNVRSHKHRTNFLGILFVYFHALILASDMFALM